MRRIVLLAIALALANTTAAAQDPCPEVALIATGGRSFAVWLKDTTARPVDSVVVSTRGEWDKALEDVVKWRRARDKHRYDVFALPTFRTRGECRGVTVPPDSTIAVADSSIATPPDSTPPVQEPAPDSTVVVEPPADTTPVPLPPPPPPPPPPATGSQFLPATQVAAWQALNASNDVRWQAALNWCGKMQAGSPGYGDSGLWCALVAVVNQDAAAAAPAIAKLRQGIPLTDRNGIRESFPERVLMRDMLAPWLTAADYAVIDPILQSWADNAASVSASDSDQMTGQGCGAILWDLATGASVDRSGIRQAIGRYVALAEGGAWPESSEYSPGTAVLFAMCELGYRTATGQEIVAGAEQFLRDAGRWTAFEITPDFRSVVTWADDQTPRKLLAYRRPIELAAMPSPAGQWT